MDSDERGSIALEESRRALDRQYEDLGRLRDRSMTLVGAAGVAAGLIVAFRPEGKGLSFWSWAGMAAFVLMALIATGIAWPQRFTFAQSPSVILRWGDDQDPDHDNVNRELALRIEEQYDGNEDRLNLLTRGYAIAIIMFSFEIALLMIDLRA